MRSPSLATAFLALISATSWGAIGFDGASQSANDLTSSPFSWTHTVLNDSDTVVVIGVAARGDATSTVTIAATYAGRAVTQIRSDQNTLSNGGAFSWLGVIQNPGVGSALITVSVTGPFDEVAGMAISLTGVAQTGQPSATSGGNCSINCTTLAAPIAIADPGSWVVDVMRIGSSPTAVAPQGTNPTQTARATVTNTNTQLFASAEGAADAGTYSDRWSWTNNTNSAALSVVSFAAQSADAGTTDGGSLDAGLPRPLELQVGCGCSAATATGLCSVVLVAAATRRRKKHESPTG